MSPAEVPDVNCAGIVLCGGESRRMGQPKAWLPFGSETLLQRIVRVLGEVVTPIVVVAAAGQELPQLPDDVRVVRDERKGRGPLEGLVAGLTALQDQADMAYVSSCDVPFLLPAFVNRMVTSIGEAQVCVPHVGGFYHPLAAIYRLEVLPLVQRLLGEDRLRPVYLFDAAPTRVLRREDLLGADPTLGSLRNLNTPEEYQAALRELESGPPQEAAS